MLKCLQLRPFSPFLKLQVPFTTNEPRSYVFSGRNHPLHFSSQRIILETYAKEQGFTNPKFLYDDGCSGTSFDRPGWNEVVRLMEAIHVRTLIVKDHSRLGRNHLIVGQLLEEDFARLNVHYIAIMDNIDTAKGLSDIVPVRDLFNEWYAKNTSQKIRSVKRAQVERGERLGSRAPTVTGKTKLIPRRSSRTRTQQKSSNASFNSAFLEEVPARSQSS